jgi:hypothetical protein
MNPSGKDRIQWTRQQSLNKTHSVAYSLGPRIGGMMGEAALAETALTDEHVRSIDRYWLRENPLLEPDED